MAASAERVPVINSATTLKDRVKAKKPISLAWRLCASSHTEKGSVHTTYSAKKLRLTNVEAGLGPWGKYLKSIQNCKAVQSDASTAPT